ncbi:MAG: DNA alkylation repair protein [Chloroflexota bacterium]
MEIDAIADSHTAEIIDAIHKATPGPGDQAQKAAYHGTPHRYLGLAVPQRRKLAKQWARAHFDINFDTWRALLDRLYHGETYEEKTIGGELLHLYPQHRRAINLGDFDRWLGQLEGWAEVDTTCQAGFVVDDLLARWDAWRPFLDRLGRDANLNKARAAFVLLTKPLDRHPDPRLWALAHELVEARKGERDKLITKAISWVLRSAITHHRAALTAYLETAADSLPAIALRETRAKLSTGKK